MSDPVDRESRCAVCSRTLPPQEGPGQPRKVCRDEDSPTPGGCARFRDNELRMNNRKRNDRNAATFTAHDRQTIDRYFNDVGQGFIIE